MELIVKSERAEKPRNFETDVRGVLDVKHLLFEAVFRKNMVHTHMSNILLHLFEETARECPNEKFDTTLFRAELFANNHDSRAPRLRQKLQAYSGKDFFDVDQSWVVCFCNLDGLKKRHIAIGTLGEPVNLGLEMEEVQIVVLVLAPAFEKHTKSALETARTVGTLLIDVIVRQTIINCETELQVAEVLQIRAGDFTTKLMIEDEEKSDHASEVNASCCCYYPGRAIIKDFKRRYKKYASDYLDGINDARSISKVISTTLFLIFTILPTSIAYGMLNDKNTGGLINVQKVILGQWIGGIFFAIFGGQPLLILSTTAPLSIYISVIHEVSNQNSWDFHQLYAAVGVYSQIILILFAVFQVADVMKFITRSTEEIFGLFIALALVIKSVHAIVNTYAGNQDCDAFNQTMTSQLAQGCGPATVLLFIFLVFGVFWLSMTLSSFRSSTYLSRTKRDLLSDYSLPVSVIIFALITFFFFDEVHKESFNIYSRSEDMIWSPFFTMTYDAHIQAVCLAIPLAVLFFMDQLLVTNTIDNKQNKIVRVRETRLATLAAHIIMIPIYFFLVPHITAFFPTALFYGLFLYMAFSSLTGNEFWERMLLIFTEQKSYPPTHYIRRVPQRKIHIFTVIELIQLLILVAVGFAPHHYVQMAFPVVIALFIPFRKIILPIFYGKRHINDIDSQH